MSKFTYLLGAGSSCETLPLNNNVKESISKLIDYFENHSAIVDENYEVYKNYLKLDLEWLLEICSLHLSVDTYAKKLHIKEEYKTLNKLKFSLSILFIIIENVYPIDKRYDAFWASILEDKNIHPGLNILSWNYDLQLERSLSNFIDLSLEKTIQLPYFSRKQNNSNRINGNTKIFKINGDVTIKKTTQTQNIEEVDFKTKENISIFLQQYKEFRENNYDSLTNISFAWENTKFKFNESLYSSIYSTQSLIVVGYSFPFFNRKIDIELLTQMKLLKRIYVQCKNDNEVVIERLRERIDAIKPPKRDLEIIPKKENQFFYIPNELNLDNI